MKRFFVEANAYNTERRTYLLQNMIAQKLFAQYFIGELHWEVRKITNQTRHL